MFYVEAYLLYWIEAKEQGWSCRGAWKRCLKNGWMFYSFSTSSLVSSHIFPSILEWKTCSKTLNLVAKPMQLVLGSGFQSWVVSYANIIHTSRKIRPQKSLAEILTNLAYISCSVSSVLTHWLSSAVTSSAVFRTWCFQQVVLLS